MKKIILFLALMFPAFLFAQNIYWEQIKPISFQTLNPSPDTADFLLLEDAVSGLRQSVKVGSIIELAPDTLPTDSDLQAILENGNQATLGAKFGGTVSSNTLDPKFRLYSDSFIDFGQDWFVDGSGRIVFKNVGSANNFIRHEDLSGYAYLVINPNGANTTFGFDGFVDIDGDLDVSGEIEVPLGAQGDGINATNLNDVLNEISDALIPVNDSIDSLRVDIDKNAADIDILNDSMLQHRTEIDALFDSVGVHRIDIDLNSENILIINDSINQHRVEINALSDSITEHRIDIYQNASDIDQLNTDLLDYWKRDGSSVASGNWDIGSFTFASRFATFNNGTINSSLALVSSDRWVNLTFDDGYGNVRQIQYDGLADDFEISAGIEVDGLMQSLQDLRIDGVSNFYDDITIREDAISVIEKKIRSSQNISNFLILETDTMYSANTALWASASNILLSSDANNSGTGSVVIGYGSEDPDAASFVINAIFQRNGNLSLFNYAPTNDEHVLTLGFFNDEIQDYVPYDGAVFDVNLGFNDLFADGIELTDDLTIINGTPEFKMNESDNAAVWRHFVSTKNYYIEPDSEDASFIVRDFANTNKFVINTLTGKVDIIDETEIQNVLIGTYDTGVSSISEVKIGITNSGGSGVYPFNTLGNLFLQPRTSVARDVVILDYLGNAVSSYDQAGIYNYISGTASVPSLRLADGNTGFYAPATNQIGVSIGGVKRGQWDSGGLDVIGKVTITGTPSNSKDLIDMEYFDANVPAQLWTLSGSDIYRTSEVWIGTSSSLAASPKLQVLGSSMFQADDSQLIMKETSTGEVYYIEARFSDFRLERSDGSMFFQYGDVEGYISTSVPTDDQIINDLTLASTHTEQWKTGDVILIDLNANTTLNVQNVPEGQTSQIRVTQNASASYTLTINIYSDSGTTIATKKVFGTNTAIDSTVGNVTKVIYQRFSNVADISYIYEN